MKSRKVLPVLIALFMIIGSFTMSFAEEATTASTTSTAAFTDIAGHWGETAIEKWSGYGMINGFEGLFRPDDSITRAEMAVLLDNMMDYQVKAANAFKDVPAGVWYEEAVLKANAAGILKGDGEGYANPTAKITKEQAALMLARAFAVKANDGKQTKFTDAASISTWAGELVYGMEAAGYINGFAGKYNPQDSIKRAEVVTIIDNAVKAYYNTAGTYTADVDGIAVIKVKDVILQGCTISGNLIIAEGVGEGDATLDSVTVKGMTVIRGGGENSVHITGTSNIASIRIEKVGDKVRIAISDGITIETVEVAAGEEIIIAGNVDTLQLLAADATVRVTGGIIASAVVEGDSSTIIVDQNATIRQITATAPITVSGTGTVTGVILNSGADGSSILTPKTTINVGSGVTGVTGGGGTEIPANSIGTNNSTGTSANVIENSGGGGGGGFGGGVTTPDPTLTLDYSSVEIGGNSVTKSVIGGKDYYLIEKDWDENTDLSAIVTGKDFVADQEYTMIVRAEANEGPLAVEFEYKVTGSAMNVENREITEMNLIDNITNANLLNDLNAMINLWVTKAAVNDTIYVTIETGGKVLFDLNLKVIDSTPTPDA